MKIVLSLSLIGCLFTTMAQTKEELTRQWEIREIWYPADFDFDGENGAKLLQLIQDLEGANFELRSSGEVDFDYWNDDLEIRGGFWIYDENGKRVTLISKNEYGERSNRQFKARISPDETHGQWRLRIEKTPFTVIIQPY